MKFEKFFEQIRFDNQLKETLNKLKELKTELEKQEDIGKIDFTILPHPKKVSDFLREAQEKHAVWYKNTIEEIKKAQRKNNIVEYSTRISFVIVELAFINKLIQEEDLSTSIRAIPLIILPIAFLLTEMTINSFNFNRGKETEKGAHEAVAKLIQRTFNEIVTVYNECIQLLNKLDPGKVSELGLAKISVEANLGQNEEQETRNSLTSDNTSTIGFRP